MKPTIAVFGCGYVGGTVADFLLANRNHVIKVDPVLYPDQDPIQAIMDSDGIVICVPTPSGQDGECDDSIVRQVLDMCDYRTRVLLKSTVTFENIETYEANVVYNPEFLREASAARDFTSQPVQIFGHHENNQNDAEWWASIFSSAHAHDIETVFTDLRTASMIKYVHNSFLATKVAWFHELYANLPSGIDYETMTDTLAMFERVGTSHMKAPNSDGKLGYGGACFPKDVRALNKIVNHSILKFVDGVNGKLNEK
jgi:UDPglucose 6-dehydrogenase